VNTSYGAKVFCAICMLSMRLLLVVVII
jgi:hypothetical protein